MNIDVYNTILKTCEMATARGRDSKSYDELALIMVNTLSTIAGICQGAISSEKVGE